jgi:hypothetical protein
MQQPQPPQQQQQQDIPRWIYPLLELVPLIRNERAMRLNINLRENDPISPIYKEISGLPAQPLLIPTTSPFFWQPPNFGGGVMPDINTLPQNFGLFFPKNKRQLYEMDQISIANLSYFYNTAFGIEQGDSIDRWRELFALFCGVRD